MKLVQLMSAVLSLPKEHKEMFQVVLNHSLKTENQNDSLIQVELETADAVAKQIGPMKLTSNNRKPGKPIDPNSTYSLILGLVQQECEVSQDNIISFLMKRKAWDRSQVCTNILNNKKRLIDSGIKINGRGPSAVWSI